jgi:bifunctional ADP-heptose synthase (sugar kinase/adenylyltransferase)
MKVLVVGEHCRDEFVYGSCERLCPEGPVPVIKPHDLLINDGMAGNVAANVRGLLHPCHHLRQDNDIIKTRYMDERSNHLLLRVDQNDYADHIKHPLIKYDDYELIIISDYDKGFLTEEDIGVIATNAKSKGIPVMLDTKKPLHKDWLHDMTFIKINEVEYERTKFTLDDLEDRLIVTLGKEGCMYQGIRYDAPKKIDTIDISGAGDTFMAAFAIRYVETKDVIESINFAQKCTSVVVQLKGVSVVSINDL